MLHHILYFFPVQLLINHLKRNHTLLCFWFVLFGTLEGYLGSFLGLRHLFLAPEYIGYSGFGGFLIMGIALGGFTMAFHSTSCILDMHRFPFVGTLSKPFAKFCLNNSIIPFAYLITYIIAIIRFQYIEQKNTPINIAIKIIGLLAGCTCISLVVFIYIALTSKDIFAYRAKSRIGRLKQAFFYRVTLARRLFFANKTTFNVKSYLENPFRLGYTKNLDKYHNSAVVAKIFNQNQLNLIFFEVMAVVMLFALGFLSHHTFSQIPAAASGILFLAILMMFIGLLSFWTRGWATTTMILLIITLNLLTKYGIAPGSRSSQAFGMCYESGKANYGLTHIQQINSTAHYLQDKQTTLQILNNWRKKFAATKAPKLVLICASGGGQRAALWVLRVLQTVDRSTQGKFMQHTMLMSCVSGGALGASYFRELYLRKKLGESIDPYSGVHLEKIARNALNPIVFNLLTNDILLDVNKFHYRGMVYRRDRGHALEDQINQLTDAILEKPLQAYRTPELKSLIPMLLLTPTIINDGRKLFISPHNVSYMGSDLPQDRLTTANPKIKGIDFMRFFRNQGAAHLRFLSALRMAATYPYILPSIMLPSTPAIEVMDAALFDNFGVTDAVRFLYVFREWIAKHTSGVILVTIRSTAQDKEPRHSTSQKSLFQKLNNPIENLQTAWINMQDIRNDDLIKLTNEALGHRVTAISFQYTPIRQEKGRYASFRRASLSWHLTNEEKQHIVQAMYAKNNQAALTKLKALLE